ncbi:hypothetical protein [Nitrosococcus watsonii]|uniref:hypothetical protein n=1 Tax=Nitrosococcus watsonii TaxID=473531 RepID=UPI00059B7723|nr:hypothetical protein [Nitrosococcus watsonii]
MYRFTNELQAIANEKNAKTAYEYVKKLANRRNKALYAAPQGIPHAENVEDFLIYRKFVWFSYLAAYLLIEPYSERQGFVVQAISAYLQLLRLVSIDTSET